MKTELARVAEQQNLTYDAKAKVMFGQYKGYKVAVREDMNDKKYFYNFPMKPSDFTQSDTVNTFIQELLQDKKFIKKVVYVGHSLKLDVAMAKTAKGNNNNIINLLDKIVSYAKDNSYETCCELCGESTEISAYQIDELTLYGCEVCYNNEKAHLDGQQDKAKKKKGNFVTGFVGAIVGALIGVTIWVAVYAIGYIAAICGIVLAVCVIKGYELFGGKLNVLGIITTMLITIFMVYAATYLSYGYTVYVTFKDSDNIDLFTAIRSVRGLLEDFPDVSSSFYIDLLKGYLFTVVGSVSTFISAYKTSNGKYSAKKLAA